MKNAMKKLMSLLLVAVLLVSAVPFQADAAASAVSVYYNGQDCGYHNLTQSGSAVNLENEMPYIFGFLGIRPTDYNNFHYKWYSNKDSGDAESFTYEVQNPRNVDLTNKGEGWALRVVVTSKPIDSGDQGTAATDPGVKHTVRFMVNGSNIYSVQVADGAKLGDSVVGSMISADKISAPVGQEFAGWVEVDTKTPYLSSEEVHANLTFYAQFKNVETNNGTGTGTGSGTGTGTGTGNGTSSTTYNVYFCDNGGNVMYTVTVAKGAYVTSNQVSAAANAVAKAGYNFTGWTLNGAGAILDNTAVVAAPVNATVRYIAQYSQISNSTTSNKGMNQLFLNIFTNGNVLTPARTVDISNYVIADDSVTLAEVMTVVDDYYKAVDANKGIVLDGIYLAKGNYIVNYGTDQKYPNGITGLNAMRQQYPIVLNVMATNVTAKTAYTADSTNPKTGDEIYMAVTVLGVSAAALAAVMYFYNKKRHTA